MIDKKTALEGWQSAIRGMIDKIPIDAQIALMEKEIDEHGQCYDSVHFNLYEAQQFLATLTHYKRIMAAEMPEEPGCVSAMRAFTELEYERVAAAVKHKIDESLPIVAHIDTLHDLLRRERADRVHYQQKCDMLSEATFQSEERAESAERKLAALVELGREPSEEIVSAGLSAEGHIDDEFKAMFAKVCEQAGVK